VLTVTYSSSVYARPTRMLHFASIGFALTVTAGIAAAQDVAPVVSTTSVPAPTPAPTVKAVPLVPLVSKDRVIVDEPLASSQFDGDAYVYRTDGKFLIDAGFVTGFPTALTTGLTSGVAAGITIGECPMRWGVRAAWVTATENSLDWTVTDSDTRLRATGSIQYDAGRGVIAARAGVGPTLIHEYRLRNLGKRAGLTGTDLENSAFLLVPSADLDGLIQVRIAGQWSMMLAGGPSMSLVSKSLHANWNAELGVAWQM
jgi:hypothetical protein